MKLGITVHVGLGDGVGCAW